MSLRETVLCSGQVRHDECLVFHRVGSALCTACTATARFFVVVSALGKHDGRPHTLTYRLCAPAAYSYKPCADDEIVTLVAATRQRPLQRAPHCPCGACVRAPPAGIAVRCVVSQREIDGLARPHLPDVCELLGLQLAKNTLMVGLSDF